MLLDEHRRQVARYARLADNAKSRGAISQVPLKWRQPRLKIRVEASLLLANDVKIVIPEHLRHVFGGAAIVQYLSRPIEHGGEFGLNTGTRFDNRALCT